MGELELDQGKAEEALGTLSRALGCAYRLAASSDVVSEVSVTQRLRAPFETG